MGASLFRTTASAIAAILCVGLGCVSPVVPIDPGQPVSLGEGEGLVVLHIDTDVKISLLRGSTLNPVPFAEDVPVGESIWMVRMQKGDYAWRRIEIEDREGTRRRYSIDSGPKYRFDVEAGVVNYAGELRVRLRTEDDTLFIDRRDRSGYALRRLRDSHASILAHHDLRYGGRTRHDFLAYFTRARSAARGGVEADARTGEP